MYDVIRHDWILLATVSVATTEPSCKRVPTSLVDVSQKVLPKSRPDRPREALGSVISATELLETWQLRFSCDQVHSNAHPVLLRSYLRSVRMHLRFSAQS